jgi:DNA-directed RNA polymerase specialized sigma24 family protein
MQTLEQTETIQKRMPWPRCDSEDPSTPLGVDVDAKMKDITKIVYKHFHIKDVGMDELLQEVRAAIIHKNHSPSAHNPKKSSFSHYVFMVARNVVRNLVQKKKRYDREILSEDVYENGNDLKTLVESASDAISYEEFSLSDDFFGHVRDVERNMRRRGMIEHARYLRAASTGASTDIIREAMSFGRHNITNKHLRSIKHQISEYAQL